MTDADTGTRHCERCGVQLGEGQDWCLQCGAAAPGSLKSQGPGWRSATVVLGATAALVLGAAAAAYAALSQPAPAKLAPKVITIAQAPPATTPSTPTAATTPTTPSGHGAPLGALGTPTTIKPLPSKTTPPKIPLSAPTPKATAPAPGTSKANETGAGKAKSEAETGPAKTEEEEPTPILLDTNAASTYNPYHYPEAGFGDPSLAIDGETSTGWSAQVEPSVAPRMAVGLAIDLKAPQRIGAVTLITSTPGMTVQVYGSEAKALPESITDPTWIALTHSVKAKKRKTHLKLKDSNRAFRFIVLWISRAPASAVGTPAAPGHVSVNELELFAPTGK